MKIGIDDLLNWFKYLNQINNGYHMGDTDYRELIRLNHRIMEQANKIHNDNMLKD